MFVGFMTRYFMVAFWGFSVGQDVESLHRVTKNMHVKPSAQYIDKMIESLIVLIVLLHLFVRNQQRGWHVIQILQQTCYVYPTGRLNVVQKKVMFHMHSENHTSFVVSALRQPNLMSR